MPQRWLQIKGDPSVRAFLFQQQRQSSLFDEHIQTIHSLVYQLLVFKGAFHIKVHYPSSQLTCWFYDDPYNYKVFVKEEVLDPAFIYGLPDISYETRQPRIEKDQISLVLNEFHRLRFTDEQIYLRSGSLNRINGMIGMNFSCDGSHYIEHDEFFNRLNEFGANMADPAPLSVAV